MLSGSSVTSEDPKVRPIPDTWQAAIVSLEETAEHPLVCRKGILHAKEKQICPPYRGNKVLSCKATLWEQTGVETTELGTHTHDPICTFPISLKPTVDRQRHHLLYVLTSSWDLS